MARSSTPNSGCIGTFQGSRQHGRRASARPMEVNSMAVDGPTLSIGHLQQSALRSQQILKCLIMCSPQRHAIAR
eukprot:44454-Amphidinium_carterae.1